MPEIDQIDESELESLHEQTHGDVLHPGDEGYGEARTVWNGMIDRYPAVIVQPTGAADVMTAVDFVREHDIAFSVKGGGHNLAGKGVCDDGLTIDLSRMDAVRVDPASKTAIVGPGARWGDFDHEAQAHGLATTGGVDSRTGVAGLTLGGGYGWLARTHGLACDNLVGAAVVTAEGELVHASAEENPDLFWGLRGGGGNFGIVTSFEYQLHEVGPEVLTAQVFHPFEDARETLRFYREYVADAPDEVTCNAFVLHVPPEPPFPEAHHGESTIALVASYAGDPAEGRPALEPLELYGDPIFAVVDRMPYTAFQQNFDDGFPDGARYYGKSAYLEALSDDIIDEVVSRAESMPGPYTGVWFESWGGAIGGVEPMETAFPHRDAPFNLGMQAGWEDPDQDDELIGWVREFHEAVAPFSTDRVYSNYLDQDEDDRVADAYAENYERLAELKAEWDPDNLFSRNQNVAPAD